MPTALIVGAGIGGLSAAIALRRVGWTVRVFERAATPRELGFGVGLAPNAMAALAELGIADQVIERGFLPMHSRGEVRRMDGTVIKRAEFPPQEALGGPFVMAMRPALHGALLDAAGADSISLSSSATGFTESAGHVTLHLENGSSAEGDVLIAADGVHSVIRRTLHPNEAPARSSNIVAVRGGVHGAIEHLQGLAAIYYMGRGVESIFVRAGTDGIYWFVSVASELIAANAIDPHAILRQLAPRFDATFRAIAAATTDLRSDELVDRDPIAWWGRGRVTLLGDAAHPLLPHTGQGAAQAMVDAVTLANTLHHDRDAESALRKYEDERRPKTAVLVGQGRRTARIMRTTNAAICYTREVAVRVAPVKMIVKALVAINRRAGTDVRR